MDLKDARILLVDDFELVRVMFRDILAKLGATQIDEATDGRDALAKINDALRSGVPYQVVFCDWVMPEVSGIEVVEACRDNPALEDMILIMVTAESDQEGVVQAILAGVTDYIVKPFSPETLEKKLLKIMSKNLKVAA